MDIVFNHKAGTLVWNGQPSPENVIEEPLDYNRTFEGLVGGELPIVHFVLSVAEGVSPGGWWEVTAVPKPENDGNHEQVCFFRFQRVIQPAPSAPLSLGRSVYFETYQYSPALSPPSRGTSSTRCWSSAVSGTRPGRRRG